MKKIDDLGKNKGSLNFLFKFEYKIKYIRGICSRELVKVQKVSALHKFKIIYKKLKNIINIFYKFIWYLKILLMFLAKTV